jgi:predicted Zn finger-like uncharacterized protein
MIITCTECQTRFRLADEKLKPGGTKVRCSVCQQIFTVFPPAAAPAAEPVAASNLGDREQPPSTTAATAERFAAEAPSAAPGAPAFGEALGAGPGFGGPDDMAGAGGEPGATTGPDALSFTEGTDEDADQFDFGEQPDAAEGITSFGFDEEPSATDSPLATEPVFGDEWAASWDQPEAESSAFDFDAPSFETGTATTEINRGEAGLSFDEIEFSHPGGGETAAISTPPEQAAAPTPITPAPPISRPVPSRPRSEEFPPPPARSTMARNVVVLLLLILCGIGGYFYFVADGRQMFERLLTQLSGSEPAVPVEQRIGLEIAGSSYVQNQEAGQLLIIQGSAINHFAGARSAITVKGVIQDATGKVLQQQTVFCGNYLDEEQLRTLKYVQIEEAMNNQFGNSLSNMNIKSGTAIPFTIVFRNVPKELANINVEVVDSKPGGP